MDKYERLEKITRFLSIGIGIIAGKFAYELALQELASGQPVPPNQTVSNLLSIPVLLITVGVVTGVVEYVIEFAFDSLRFVRRFLIGRMFIEGTWIEVIRYRNAIVSVSKVFLRSSGYDVTLSGINQMTSTSTRAEDQAAAAELANGHFHAELVRIKWPTLQYIYTHYPANPSGRDAEQRGYGALQFTEREQGAPRHFSGFFIHVVTGTRYYVQARKVTDRSFLRKLDDPKFWDETVAAEATRTQTDDAV